MKNLTKKIVFVAVVLWVVFAYIYRNDINGNTFDINKFESEMKAKNYELKIINVKQEFLPTTRKRMIIGEEAVDIYLYGNNKKMENDAKNIDSGGCEYTSKGDILNSVKVSWISEPHFYKKGKIIVLYVGTNEKIISDLKEIFGEEFAGTEKYN
ncbi:hypothetical protein [Oceanirhabdus sp. W0125-5]|uniref:hypothetical protein n=1 Tax=Oceanirhabdus sp. W0125-5 TaxID=2999116 RepID=UPI0022F2CF3F|nr:hypothetical protein [Oceanirhabdus sp. W0125-5]WBW98341.1 hypothetical protein OW730_06120 [Oceanirhabdus sp. W0125-5]